MNPQEHGLIIADAREPELRAIWVYPLSDNSFINGQQGPVRVPLRRVGQGSYIPAEPLPQVWGTMGLGIEAADRDDLGDNQNGLISWSLFEGPDRIFHAQNNVFSFVSTRYVNALVDYRERLYKKRTVYLLYRLPGNKFPYLQAKQGALPSLFTDSVLSLGILAADAAGNTSAVEFELPFRAPQQAQRDAETEGTPVAPEKAAKWKEGAIAVDIPAFALYAPAKIHIQPGAMDPLGLPEFSIGPEDIPLHTYATVRVKPSFEHAWKDKTLAIVQKNGQKINLSVDWLGGEAVFKTRDLGKVSWAIDTLAPVLRTLHAPGPSAPETARFKVSDNLSGLEAYTATLNGKWILMTLDAKSGRLTIPGLKSKLNGPGRLEIVLTDKVGNSTTAVFEYR